MITVKNPSTKAGDTGDVGLISRLGRSPGGGHGNPLQYSCLGNPMDREAGGLQTKGSQRVMTEILPLVFICVVYLFLVGEQLFYNIVLVSAIHQYESATCIHTSPPSWTVCVHSYSVVQTHLLMTGASFTLVSQKQVFFQGRRSLF